MADLPEKITVRWGKSGDVRVSSPDGRYVGPDIEGEYTLSASAARILETANTAPQWDLANDRLIVERDDALTRLAAAEAQVGALERERDDALAFLDNAISDAPDPLQALGRWLADTLDEDDWPTAERFLNAAVKSCAALASAAGGAK